MDDSYTSADGNVYTLMALPTLEGVRLGTIVLRLAGHSLVDTKPGTGFGAMLGAAVTQPGLSADVSELVRSFAKYTTVRMADGKMRLLSGDDFYEVHFQRRYDAMIGWLAAHVMYNLSSFLGGTHGLATRLMAVAASFAPKQKDGAETPSDSQSSAPPKTAGKTG